MRLLLRLGQSDVRRVSFARTFFLLAGAAFVPSACLVGACASKHGATDPTSDASAALTLPDVGHLDEPYYPDASCPVTIDSPPLLPGTHVPIGSSVTWSSNPPSSGAHYPIWAAFKTYDKPVDLGYLVHDLEHGAILFLYRCDDAGGCADVVKELESAVAALPDDPICATSVRVRAVVAPDPLLDVPIAAAAWGWTYKAECVDLPTLIDFARTHYGRGPETLCTDGQPSF
jgi:hypothetical protein